ncbi:MAG: tRNA (N6-isopentenyl adenosine(37)-C2)-methylthiotransferase MiaB [Deltaproteobacteria bacterium]|jgi:tRNA-2-methylthio-N6-dimethylallyladenosine synthase|nr:tRNA (N6-isopentenyl adenosine(37)-C2)-methylthiotransferase MiaB [Deltaproteobacteria bacterium]
MRKRFHILTFGCQMNANDSAWLARALTDRGHVPSSREEADVHILNTCSVRAKPEDKVYTELGRISLLAQKSPERKILACVGGCVAQQCGERLFARSRELRLLFGTDGLAAAPEAIDLLLSDPQRKITLLDFNETFAEQGHKLKAAATGPAALVSIMRGCDNFCAYCIVPLVRGRQKSRGSEDILAECRALIAGGAREITLLGQNVNSFGQDSLGDGSSFSTLLYRVAELPGLARLRFMTSHPKDMAPALVQAFAQIPLLAPRLHLPLQSGSDRVLRAMGRGYTRAEYIALVCALRQARPDIHISTDIIVGFPGENEQDFEDTLDAMQEADFCASFSFVYSDRPGTKAATMPDKIPPALALERLSRLQVWQNHNSARILEAMRGQSAHVLLEGPSLKNPASSWSGREAHDFAVNLYIPPAHGATTGDMLKVRITGSGKPTLKGELAE